jgi:hypothetical protein
MQDKIAGSFGKLVEAHPAEHAPETEWTGAHYICGRFPARKQLCYPVVWPASFLAGHTIYLAVLKRLSGLVPGAKKCGNGRPGKKVGPMAVDRHQSVAHPSVNSGQGYLE